MADEPQTTVTPQGGIPSTLAEIVKLKPEIQQDVDSIVEARLRRDRETRGQDITKLETDLRTVTEKLTAAESKVTTLEQASATAAQSETALKETLAGIMADIPEEKRKRIPDLPADKQIRYIIANKDLFFVEAASPITLPPSGKLPAGQQSTGEIPMAKTPREAREIMLGKN
jgi:hypothetical protein